MVLVEAGTPWHGIRTIQLAKTDIFFCISALPLSCHIVIIGAHTGIEIVFIHGRLWYTANQSIYHNV